LPPVEGIFFNGQIFDAYVFAAQLVKSASSSLLLIDNYVDESVLLLFSKRAPGVTATIYTQRITQQLQLDLTRYNSQYPQINIHTYQQAHDRFLIIDNTEVYHIGVSLKDLGKIWKHKRRKHTDKRKGTAELIRELAHSFTKTIRMLSQK
jgi:hypothetical protein